VDWNSLGFKSQQVQSISIFSKRTKPAMGPTQKSIECLGSAISARAKRPSWEDGHCHVLSTFCVCSPLRLHGVESDEFTRTFTFTFNSNKCNSAILCLCKRQAALCTFRVPCFGTERKRPQIENRQASDGLCVIGLIAMSGQLALLI